MFERDKSRAFTRDEINPLKAQAYYGADANGQPN
jgi:hypothetical protein